jgi:hypothetical protein
VSDIKASKIGVGGGSNTVGVMWEGEAMEKQTMMTAQRVFDAKQAAKAAAAEAKREAAKAAGIELPKPPRGMVSRFLVLVMMLARL